MAQGAGRHGSARDAAPGERVCRHERRAAHSYGRCRKLKHSMLAVKYQASKGLHLQLIKYRALKGQPALLTGR